MTSPGLGDASPLRFLGKGNKCKCQSLYFLPKLADDGLVGGCWVDNILIEDGPVEEDLVGDGVVVGDELAGDCFVCGGLVGDCFVGDGSAGDCSGVEGDGDAVEI